MVSLTVSYQTRKQSVQCTLYAVACGWKLNLVGIFFSQVDPAYQVQSIMYIVPSTEMSDLWGEHLSQSIGEVYQHATVWVAYK